MTDSGHDVLCLLISGPMHNEVVTVASSMTSIRVQGWDSAPLKASEASAPRAHEYRVCSVYTLAHGTQVYVAVPHGVAPPSDECVRAALATKRLPNLL